MAKIIACSYCGSVLCKYGKTCPRCGNGKGIDVDKPKANKPVKKGKKSVRGRVFRVDCSDS